MKNLKSFADKFEVEEYLEHGWEIFVNNEFVNKELYEQLKTQQTIEGINKTKAEELLFALHNPSLKTNLELGQASFEERKARLEIALQKIQDLWQEEDSFENMQKIYELSGIIQYFNLNKSPIFGDKNYFSNLTGEKYIELENIAIEIANIVGVKKVEEVEENIKGFKA